MTASITSRSTNGRARVVHQHHRASPGPARASPAATESLPLGAAGDDQHEPCAGESGQELGRRFAHRQRAAPARPAPTSGWATNGRSARSTMGTPAIGRYCLGSSPPSRVPWPAGNDDYADVTRQAPAPAARRGRARPSTRRRPATPLARRAEHPAEAEPRRLGEPPLDRRRSGGSRRRGRSRRGRSRPPGPGRL